MRLVHTYMAGYSDNGTGPERCAPYSSRDGSPYTGTASTTQVALDSEGNMNDRTMSTETGRGGGLEHSLPIPEPSTQPSGGAWVVTHDCVPVRAQNAHTGTRPCSSSSTVRETADKRLKRPELSNASAPGDSLDAGAVHSAGYRREMGPTGITL